MNSVKAAPPQPLLPKSNWRTAASALQVSAPSTSTRRPASQTSGDNDFSFLELDYSDFEQAMREEDNGGMNPMGGAASTHSSSPSTRGCPLERGSIPTYGASCWTMRASSARTVTSTRT